MSATMTQTPLTECEQAGREGGLAAGLAAALRGVTAAELAPGRFAAVPADQLPDGARKAADQLTVREEIGYLAVPGTRPAPDPAQLLELGRRLAAARLGVTRRLLDQAVGHLSERGAGGEALVRKQLVVGTIADAAAQIELLREYARTVAGPTSLADLHDRISELDWQVAGLFGAAGYIADHPARALYVSELVAGSWIAREAQR